jgi:hypothetical protein
VNKENIFEELSKMQNLIVAKAGTVISEQPSARLQNIANMQKTVDAQGIIKNPASQFNNTRWADYIARFSVTQDEINQSKELTKTQKAEADNTQKRLQNIANMARVVNADGMIVNPASQFNNTPWADYIKRFKVTQDEINKANELNKKASPASSGQRRQSTQPSQSSVNDRFTKTAESLGVKGGKMDLQTLQTMIKTLDGGSNSTPTQETPDLAQLTAAINQLNQ